MNDFGICYFLFKIIRVNNWLLNIKAIYISPIMFLHFLFDGGGHAQSLNLHLPYIFISWFQHFIPF